MNERSLMVNFQARGIPMTTNNLRLEQRREQIIQAALGCFIERGFHQTGMRDIAAAAG
jgi:AcrR family transcriptional regulator